MKKPRTRSRGRRAESVRGGTGRFNRGRSRGCPGGWLRRLATEAAERSSGRRCASRRVWRPGCLRRHRQLPPRGGGATRRAGRRRPPGAQPRVSRRVAPSPRDGSGGEEQRAEVREQAGVATGLLGLPSAASPARRGSHPPSRPPEAAGAAAGVPAGGSVASRRRGCPGGWLRRLATEAAERSSERRCARRRVWRLNCSDCHRQLPPRGGGATRRAGRRGPPGAQPRVSRRVAPSRCDGSGGEEQRAAVREEAGVALELLGLQSAASPARRGSHPPSRPPGTAGAQPRVSSGWLRRLATEAAERSSGRCCASRRVSGGWLRRLATEAAERSSERWCASRRVWRPGCLGCHRQLPPRGGGATRRACGRGPWASQWISGRGPRARAARASPSRRWVVQPSSGVEESAA